LYLTATGLSGPVTNFPTNGILYGIFLHNNYFSGTVPSMNGNQYYYLYYQNNRFSGNIPMQQGSNIRRFYVHYNQLTGTIPTFEFCPRLQYAYFYNNRLTDYTPGSFAKNTWLRRLDISNNNISVGAIKAIIIDMVTNYQLNPRRGVVINMLGQSDSSGAITEDRITNNDETITENLQFLRTVGWTILI
jgi:hypothetical protein